MIKKLLKDFLIPRSLIFLKGYLFKNSLFVSVFLCFDWLQCQHKYIISTFQHLSVLKAEYPATNHLFQYEHQWTIYFLQFDMINSDFLSLFLFLLLFSTLVVCLCSYLQSNDSKDFQRCVIDMLEDAEVVSTMLLPGVYVCVCISY